ncbi:hypothetical protein SAMN02745166_02016 [Prosthecobacter debontii]|uniref:Uncharacterized protein n=1 Tax=Prosthecobacter debontii TaxID=48467 RepID=A0A1T4XV93_9BACT|nr:hypothetical protein SAMN02745166_02016 [Prosthecobacter debontii]
MTRSCFSERLTTNGQPINSLFKVLDDITNISSPPSKVPNPRPLHEIRAKYKRLQPEPTLN